MFKRRVLPKPTTRRNGYFQNAHQTPIKSFCRSASSDYIVSRESSYVGCNTIHWTSSISRPRYTTVHGWMQCSGRSLQVWIKWGGSLWQLWQCLRIFNSRLTNLRVADRQPQTKECFTSFFCWWRAVRIVRREVRRGGSSIQAAIDGRSLVGWWVFNQSSTFGADLSACNLAVAEDICLYAVSILYQQRKA